MRQLLCQQILACSPVELYEQLAHHVRQVGDDFLTVLLHADCGGVARRMSVHRPDHSGDRRLARVS